MRAGDVPLKATDRCDRHPGSRAITRCDGCGRPMCITCATPVRGETYGQECLDAILGSASSSGLSSRSSAGVTAAIRAPDALFRIAARICFGLALLATVLPWSRFGPGSGAFGAWSRSPQWSVVTAAAAAAGLALTLAQRHPRLRSPRLDAVAAALGATVAVSSLLGVLFPPAFSRPWLGPWIAVGCGAVASGAALLARRAAERSTAGV